LLRHEAVLILKEICECIPNESDVSCIFLEPTKKASDPEQNEYNLHIEVPLDKFTRQLVESVTRKHGLIVKESNGKLTIYTVEKPIAILICDRFSLVSNK